MPGTPAVCSLLDWCWTASRRVCTVDYTQKFVLNTVVMPVVLLCLVTATWIVHEGGIPESAQGHGCKCRRRGRVPPPVARTSLPKTSNIPSPVYKDSDEALQAWRSDNYFAFFLCCESGCAVLSRALCAGRLMRGCEGRLTIAGRVVVCRSDDDTNVLQSLQLPPCRRNTMGAPQGLRVRVLG